MSLELSIHLASSSDEDSVASKTQISFTTQSLPSVLSRKRLSFPAYRSSVRVDSYLPAGYPANRVPKARNELRDNQFGPEGNWAIGGILIATL
ncbi:hypothetical protein N7540_013191 [Penicillium herquei]|nr:hypothetical protein N7540_013191 [Penicillium herquei]